jgi:hypothetical protein
MVIGFDPLTMAFAPIQCTFEDLESTASYHMFTLNALSDEKQQCNNDIIGLHVGYHGETVEWQFSHILFLFSGKDGHYNLKCNIAVCDLNEEGLTACNHAIGQCQDRATSWK